MLKKLVHIAQKYVTALFYTIEKTAFLMRKSHFFEYLFFRLTRFFVHIDGEICPKIGQVS